MITNRPYFVDAGNPSRYGRFRIFAHKTGTKESYIELGLPDSNFDPFLLLFPTTSTRGNLRNDGTGQLYWSNDASIDSIRSGRIRLNEGRYQIIYKDSMGTNLPFPSGAVYNMFFDVLDSDNATPAYNVTNRTEYGFYVEVYADNIDFGWKAELTLQ